MTAARSRFIPAILTVTAILVIGAATLPLIRSRTDHALITELASLRSTLPPGVTMTWDRAVSRPIRHGARLTGVRITTQGAALTIAALEISDFTQTAGPDGGTAHFGQLVAHTVTLSTPQIQVQTKKAELKDLTVPGRSAPLTAMTLAHGTLSALTLTIPARRAQLTLRQAALEQYGKDHPSRLELTGLGLILSGDTPRAISLGHAILDGEDLASALDAWEHQKGFTLHEGMTTIHLDDLKIARPVAGEKDPAPVMSLSRMTGFANTEDQKSRVSLSVSRLKLPPGSPAFSVFPGSSELETSNAAVILTGMYDAEASVAHIAQLDINATGLGRLDLSGDFSGIRRDSAGTAQADTSRLEFHWRDDGLVPRILHTVAAAESTTTGSYLPRLQSALAPRGTPPDSPRARIATYLSHNGNRPLTLIFEPDQPVPVREALPAVIHALEPGKTPVPAGLIVEAPEPETPPAP